MQFAILNSRYPGSESGVQSTQKSSKHSQARGVRALRRTRGSDSHPSGPHASIPRSPNPSKVPERFPTTRVPRPPPPPPPPSPGEAATEGRNARLTCCKYIKVKAHESWGHMPTLGSATQVAPVRGCCILAPAEHEWARSHAIAAALCLAATNFFFF